jgi:hypothetical protein
VFLVNLPIGLVCLVLAPRLVKESREAGQSPTPDWLGAATLAGSVVALTLTLAKGDGWNWDSRVLAAISAAVLLGAVVVIRARSHPAPVIDASLFRTPGYTGAVVAAAAFWGAFDALLLASSLHLAATRDHSILEAGLLLAPGPAASGVAAATAGRLVGKVAPARLAFLGTVCFLTPRGTPPRSFPAPSSPGSVPAPPSPA